MIDDLVQYQFEISINTIWSTTARTRAENKPIHVQHPIGNDLNKSDFACRLKLFKFITHICRISHDTHTSYTTSRTFSSTHRIQSQRTQSAKRHGEVFSCKCLHRWVGKKNSTSGGFTGRIYRRKIGKIFWEICLHYASAGKLTF